MYIYIYYVNTHICIILGIACIYIYIYILCRYTLYMYVYIYIHICLCIFTMYIIFIIQKQHKTTVFVSVTSQKNHPLRRHRGQGSLGLQPGTIEVRRHGNTYRTYVSFCDIVIYYDMIYIYYDCLY